VALAAVQLLGGFEYGVAVCVDASDVDLRKADFAVIRMVSGFLPEEFIGGQQEQGGGESGGYLVWQQPFFDDAIPAVFMACVSEKYFRHLFLLQQLLDADGKGRYADLGGHAADQLRVGDAARSEPFGEADAVLGSVPEYPNATAPRTEACGYLHASLGAAEGCVTQKISCWHVFQSFHFGLRGIKKAAASSFVTKMPPLIFRLVFSFDNISLYDV